MSSENNLDVKEKEKHINVLSGIGLGILYYSIYFFRSNTLGEIISQFKNNDIDISIISYITNIFVEYYLRPIGIQILAVFLTFMVLTIIQQKFKVKNKIFICFVGFLMGFSVAVFPVAVLLGTLMFVPIIGLAIWFSIKVSIFLVRNVIWLNKDIILSVDSSLNLNIFSSLKLSSLGVQVFLDTLAFAVFGPYIYRTIMRFTGAILGASTPSHAVNYFLALFRQLTIKRLRLIAYSYIFFIYTIGNLVEFSQELYLVKEALLSFVLLDVVVYAFYEKYRKIRFQRCRAILEQFKDELHLGKAFLITHDIVGRTEVHTYRIKLSQIDQFEYLKRKLTEFTAALYLIEELEEISISKYKPKEMIEKIERIDQKIDIVLSKAL